MRSLFGNVFVDKAPIGYTSINDNKLALPGSLEYGYTENLASYNLNSTLYSVVSFLSSSVSQVNWRLFRKSSNGNEEDRKEVLVHPALTVLNAPNNFNTRADLFEAAQQHMELAGESWLVIERAPTNQPIGVWLARPDRMAVVKSKTEFLIGYSYLQPDGSRQPLAVEDVIQLKFPNPLDPYRGLGPVNSLLSTMYSDNAAELHSLSFWNNNAMPAGIMSIETNMNDESWKRNIERWNAQHKGPKNAGKIAFIEAGKFQTVGFSNKDTQMLEARGFTEDKIREAYGVSKAMLGVVDDVNRANNEAQQANYSEYKLKPRLEKYKAALNNQFLPLFGNDMAKAYEFDYDDVTIEDQAKIIADRDSKVNAAVALINAGADPKATLAAFGLPDITFSRKETNGQVQTS